MDIVAARTRHNSTIVITHLDRTYDKLGLPAPMVVGFSFSIDDSVISQSIVLHNAEG
jgi:hypothetical protein